MSAASSSGASAAPDAARHGDASRKKKWKNPIGPRNVDKPAPRSMIAYEYRLSLPFFVGDDETEMVKLAYLDLPSSDENSPTGISHNLIIRKASQFYVPCTFRARNDKGYQWPLVANKTQRNSALVPAIPSVIRPNSCRDCEFNSKPNKMVDISCLDNINEAVPQTKLDNKHTVIVLIHTSNRFYPFCMEFTYSENTSMQVSVAGSDYPCCGTPTSIHVRPKDRAQALSITVEYHNKTYVIEHPKFNFSDDITFRLESRVYKLELSDLNMRTMPLPGTLCGECYFRTIRDSNGKYAYYFMKQGSDRELIPISKKIEPVFAKNEWSSSDKFKAQVTSLSWVQNTVKVDLREEFLRFGVSGTVIIQSDNIYRTKRLFKPFLMNNAKAFILEKNARLKVLCTSL